jgi:hypothetical protein
LLKLDHTISLLPRVENRPPKIDPSDAHRGICKVLESLGYHIQKQNTEYPPYDLFATHTESLPVIVNLLPAATEIACHWSCTERAKINHEAFAVFVKSLSALCQSVACTAEEETMTLRAYYPYLFDPDLFRSFMETWMEDVADILSKVQRNDLGFLEIEVMH